MNVQGTPCWYELGTSDLEAARDFYGKVLGWEVVSAGMEGFDYRLAKSDGDMVAGMWDSSAEENGPPPSWLIYFGADDCDSVVKAVMDAGGSVLKPAADIPGTGRFAVVADPQGAVFGVLQPAPMDAPQNPAFDQRKAGHGNWHELMSSDPEAGFAFYSKLFGWQKSTAMDMGEMGTYQLFSHGGADIGGMMGLGPAPVSYWMPYFGANGIDAAIDRIKAGGGTIQHGPAEVPGGAFIAIATDPQGAWFAVVGPKAVS